MNLKDYCKAGHLVVLNNGLRCLLIPNKEGLQLVALPKDFVKAENERDAYGREYIWQSSLKNFNGELMNYLPYLRKSVRIDKIYGLALFGRFWEEDKLRDLLWERRKTDDEV